MSEQTKYADALVDLLDNVDCLGCGVTGLISRLDLLDALASAGLKLVDDGERETRAAYYAAVGAEGPIT